MHDNTTGVSGKIYKEDITRIMQLYCKAGQHVYSLQNVHVYTLHTHCMQSPTDAQI